MPKPYSLDLRERVFRYADEGHSRRAAAAHFGVSVSFVVNLVKAFRMRGSLAPQSGMLSERHDDGLFLDGQDRRFGFLRSRRHVRDRGPPLPLGDRLLIDSVALRQRPQARLTMLYRSTDRLCRCGAPV